MTAEPKFGPWIAWNATPDSTCPADAIGKRVQVQCANETRLIAEQSTPFDDLDDMNWRRVDRFSIIAYRVLIEPVRGEETLWREDGEWSDCDYGRSTHRLTLPTIDGALIPGTYTGPDGAVIKVEAV